VLEGVNWIATTNGASITTKRKFGGAGA